MDYRAGTNMDFRKDDFYIKELDVKKDLQLMEDIVSYEDKVFGEGAIGKWNIKPFVKYGKVFVVVKLLKDEEGKIREKLVSVVEVLSSFNYTTSYIYGVFTVSEYEGQGHAGRLLKHVLKYLTNGNVTEVELTVDINNVRAQKLYGRFGFKVVERLDNEYGTGVHRYLMRYKKIL